MHRAITPSLGWLAKVDPRTVRIMGWASGSNTAAAPGNFGIGALDLRRALIFLAYETAR